MNHLLEMDWLDRLNAEVHGCYAVYLLGAPDGTDGK